MSAYLLIESRDPFENNCSRFHQLAIDLVKEGNDVTLFLVQNGVFPARDSSSFEQLELVSDAGVKIMADDFSLRERGIAPDHMNTCVQAAPLDFVIDRMAEGHKVMWH
ncbi:DsrE family protein [Spongorhabdus nitratireducens]